jgi:hypothetical protein
MYKILILIFIYFIFLFTTSYNFVTEFNIHEFYHKKANHISAQYINLCIMYHLRQTYVMHTK